MYRLPLLGQIYTKDGLKQAFKRIWPKIRLHLSLCKGTCGRRFHIAFSINSSVFPQWKSSDIKTFLRGNATSELRHNHNDEGNGKIIFKKLWMCRTLLVAGFFAVIARLQEPDDRMLLNLIEIARWHWTWDRRSIKGDGRNFVRNTHS